MCNNLEFISAVYLHLLTSQCSNISLVYDFFFQWLHWLQFITYFDENLPFAMKTITQLFKIAKRFTKQDNLKTDIRN